MIDRLIEFSAHHRFLVLALAAAAAFAGWQSMRRLPLDVLPDLADPQVIVYSEWDRGPDLIDAQVTTPIVSALAAVPRTTTVRGVSDFGASFVSVLFEDGTDPSWARSQTLQYLSPALQRLPQGVRTSLGPDATAVGWVFQYALVDRSGRHSLADLRAYQEWHLATDLRSVEGVAEIATLGGFSRTYQITVDPNRLRSHRLSIQRLVDAIGAGNRDTGGRTIESAGAERMVRGLGAARSTSDLEQALIGTGANGTPIRVRDVATVSAEPAAPRGVADLDGLGNVVSGIVVMRQGSNALDVIERVKARIDVLSPSLPPGVEIVPVYDRSDLIRRSTDHLRATVFEVLATVAVVILIFLWHFPSVAVPLCTLPLAVLITFIPLRALGVEATIMSLGGLAVAIGALVDAAIVVVEQTHRRLEEWNDGGRRRDVRTVILEGLGQVARPGFFALLIIGVSFLPVLTLQGEAGRLFRPLAIAKSSAMIVAAMLLVTVTPALRLLFTRVVPFSFAPAWAARLATSVFVGTLRSEQHHPLNRSIIRFYEPIVEWSLVNKVWIAAAVGILAIATVSVWQRLGSEFMPPVDEGALLYMPNTAPGIASSEAARLLQATDRRLKEFPEVKHVLGKAGRANSATDPAPLSMFETLVVLRPEEAWRKRTTWYSAWAPGWLQPALRRITSDRISRDELTSEMNEALALPGVTNTWSSPIRGRIDMASTGLRSQLGIRISGPTLSDLERTGGQVADALRTLPDTRGVFVEQFGEGSYFDIRWNRTALAEAGIPLGDGQAVVEYAIGGGAVTELVDGRERYPVTVRYPLDFRGDADAIKRLVVTDASGEHQALLESLADVRSTAGPAMLRNEGGQLTGYVYVDISSRDFSGYVDAADRTIADHVRLTPGVSVSWTGEYQRLLETRRQLWTAVPLTLLAIVVLLYINVHSFARVAIVLLAVPFSAIGALWAVYLLGYEMSAAVWVGLIALLGVDAETGMFMLLYLDEAWHRARRENRLNTAEEARQAILDGASRRVRPKFMTVATMVLGLVPIFWSEGPGAAVMQRIAAPMVGGILMSFLLELLVYPPLYHAWQSRRLTLAHQPAASAS